MITEEKFCTNCLALLTSVVTQAVQIASHDIDTLQKKRPGSKQNVSSAHWDYDGMDNCGLLSGVSSVPLIALKSIFIGASKTTVARLSGSVVLMVPTSFLNLRWGIFLVLT